MKNLNFIIIFFLFSIVFQSCDNDQDNQQIKEQHRTEQSIPHPQNTTVIVKDDSGTEFLVNYILWQQIFSRNGGDWESARQEYFRGVRNGGYQPEKYDRYEQDKRLPESTYESTQERYQNEATETKQVIRNNPMTKPQVSDPVRNNPFKNQPTKVEPIRSNPFKSSSSMQKPSSSSNSSLTRSNPLKKQ